MGTIRTGSQGGHVCVIVTSRALFLRASPSSRDELREQTAPSPSRDPANSQAFRRQTAVCIPGPGALFYGQSGVRL